MKVTLRVEGLRELEDQLRKLKRAGRKAVARRALLKAGVPLRDAARRLAPRRLNNLAESIVVSTKAHGADAGKAAFAGAMAAGGSRGQAMTAMREARRSTAGSVFVYVGPGRQPQAITQEFGTTFHRAQPFMRPAWDRTKDECLELLRIELAAEIERAIGRAAARAARAG